MNMIDAVKSVFENYANFKGRARRSEYWWWSLAQILLVMVLILPMVFIQPGSSDTGVAISMTLGIIWVIGTLIPNLAVTVRRLHDSDKSGWLYLLSLIPYIGGFILLVFMLLPGTQGRNQYGEDPRGVAASDIFA